MFQSVMTASWELCFSVHSCKLRPQQSHTNPFSVHIQLGLKWTEVISLYPKMGIHPPGLLVYEDIHSCSDMTKLKEALSPKVMYVTGYVLAWIVLKSRKLPPFSIGFQTAVVAFEYWGTLHAKEVLSAFIRLELNQKIITDQKSVRSFYHFPPIKVTEWSKITAAHFTSLF